RRRPPGGGGGGGDGAAGSRVHGDRRGRVGGRPDVSAAPGVARGADSGRRRVPRSPARRPDARPAIRRSGAAPGGRAPGGTRGPQPSTARRDARSGRTQAVVVRAAELDVPAAQLLSGTILVIPLMGRVGRALHRVLPRLFGLRGEIAAEGLTRRAERTGITTAVIGLSLGVAVVIASVAHSFRASMRNWFILSGDLIVSSMATEGSWLAMPLDASVGDVLRGLPGVERVETCRVLAGQPYRDMRIRIVTSAAAPHGPRRAELLRARSRGARRSRRPSRPRRPRRRRARDRRRSRRRRRPRGGRRGRAAPRVPPGVARRRPPTRSRPAAP